MTFNDKDKVIGIIAKELTGGSARIKALAILKNDNTIINLSENNAEELFPPKGFIFEPGFFLNNTYQVYDFVSFNVEKNERVEFDSERDRFKLKYNNSEIKKYGIDARRIVGFEINNNAVDLSLIDVKDDMSDGKFYGVTDNYIVGRLEMKNGEVTPALHRRIKRWDINEENILSYNGQMKLHYEPSGDYKVLDCMSDKQLFKWFREELNKIEPDNVKLLNEKGRWQNEFPELFSQANNDKYTADKIRLERIDEKFKFIDLSISDVKALIEKSDVLREVFIEAIETQKEEYKEEYKTELKEYHKEVETQKEKLHKELTLLQNSKKEKEAFVDTLKKEIKTLKDNKDRILGDFAIIKDVLSIESNIGKPISKQSDSFILENIEPLDDEKLVSTREEFIRDIQYQLNRYQLFPNYAKRLLDVLSIYKFVFIKDIKLGLAFVEATNNSKYIIQQVEPDWLHFSDFWNNGLGAIWQSAHKNPETLHFLFLQDINLSSPECYARPLLDMINGVRKLIPYGATAYPENLKILATKISSAEPEIGLPLIEQTFEGWGAVGFTYDVYKRGELEYKSIPGFINLESLYLFQPNEDDIEDVKLAMKENFKTIFETE